MSNEFENSGTAVLVPPPAGEAPKSREYRITLIGDSLTSGFNNYDADLHNMLEKSGWNVSVDNRGRPGATSSYGPQAADRILQSHSRPDVVVLALGGNDMQEFASPGKMQKNLEETIVKLKSQNIEVMIAGMKAMASLPEEFRRQYDRVFTDLAAKYDLVIDPLFIKTLVRDPNAKKLDDIFKPGVRVDEVHPNAVGARMIAEDLVPEVIQALERVRDREVVMPTAKLNALVPNGP